MSLFTCLCNLMLTGEHEAEEVAGRSEHNSVGRKVFPLNHKGHITKCPLQKKQHKLGFYETYRHYSLLHLVSNLHHSYTETYLFSQVIHGSHDAGQLPVFFFGIFSFALLLGAGRLLWRGHPRHS